MLKNNIKKIYEWENWEGIGHNILAILVIYIIYLFVVNKKDRTITNILLFAIIIALEILVHQNINMRNNKNTNYL